MCTGRSEVSVAAVVCQKLFIDFFASSSFLCIAFMFFFHFCFIIYAIPFFQYFFILSSLMCLPTLYGFSAMVMKVLMRGHF
jgi:hypothetical protein